MALPNSGSISLNEIHVEAGGTSSTQASINDADIRALIGAGSATEMDFSDWYGASSGPTFKGAVTDGQIYADDLSFNISSLSPAVGDLVVIAFSGDTVVYGAYVTVTGMTVTGIELNTSTGPGNYVAYGFYQSGDSTTLDIYDYSSRAASGVCAVFSGVTAFKNSARLAKSPAQGGRPNSPSLASASPTSLIIATGHLDDVNINMTAPSNGYTIAGAKGFTNPSSTSMRSSTAIAYKATSTSQTEDPSAFGTGSALDYSHAYTIRFA